MVELVLFVGLPAAGKTSFYRERFALTHVHVSKDLMPHHRRPEKRQRDVIAEALVAGRSVVVDNTNPRIADRAPLVTLAREIGASVSCYYFESDAAASLRRNRTREGPARVPDVAIFTTRKRLEAPTLDEGFDQLFVVRVDEQHRSFEVRPQMR